MSGPLDSPVSLGGQLLDSFGGRGLYTCRVTLVATSPVSGERFRVNHPQNTAEVAVAWVHDDRLEIE